MWTEAVFNGFSFISSKTISGIPVTNIKKQKYRNAKKKNFKTIKSSKFTLKVMNKTVNPRIKSQIFMILHCIFMTALFNFQITFHASTLAEIF